MIPIFDAARQYHALEDAIDGAIKGVCRSGAFINGPNVTAFEGELAGYLGIEHAVGLNSGTDALHLALRALDIGPGDEVITTPFTFAATSEAIGTVGARPVFADIEPTTFNLDPEAVEAAITHRTVAIVPVHLYGHPAPMERIMEIARRHKLAVVEDCAQAIGATLGLRPVGTFGDIGAFSFFPSKNLGAFGDGGMAVTRDAELAARLRRLRAHGSAVKYHHEELGVNSRLDELQAAILRVKLPHLEDWIAARRTIAARYVRALRATVDVPHEAPQTRHVFHQFTIRVAERDRVQAQLREAGVQTMIYYPVPLHLQEVHSDLGYERGSFPAAEAAAQTVLSLPMFPELSIEEQGRVVNALREAVELVPV